MIYRCERHLAGCHRAEGVFTLRCLSEETLPPRIRRKQFTRVEERLSLSDNRKAKLTRLSRENKRDAKSSTPKIRDADAISRIVLRCIQVASLNSDLLRQSFCQSLVLSPDCCQVVYHLPLYNRIGSAATAHTAIFVPRAEGRL